MTPAQEKNFAAIEQRQYGERKAFLDSIASGGDGASTGSGPGAADVTYPRATTARQLLINARGGWDLNGTLGSRVDPKLLAEWQADVEAVRTKALSLSLDPDLCEYLWLTGSSLVHQGTLQVSNWDYVPDQTAQQWLDTQRGIEAGGGGPSGGAGPVAAAKR